MISTHAKQKLEEIINDEGFDDVREWAADHFDLQDPVEADEIREEAKADALFEAEAERQSDATIDPLQVINSALAYGQIGRVPWALVERGDGLVLAIESINVPIDTAKEGLAAIDMARAVESHILLGGKPR